RKGDACASPVSVMKRQLVFLLLCCLLRCLLFGCHCFYSPFHLSWNIATFISSQFVSCIDSLKKIVKRKTHDGTRDRSERASALHFVSAETCCSVSHTLAVSTFIQ